VKKILQGKMETCRVVMLEISTKKISNSRFSYCESILAIDLLPISFKNNDLFSNTVFFFFFNFGCQKRNNNIKN
jgi:hypothetical protein